MSTEDIIRQIDEEISRLTKARDIFAGSSRSYIRKLGSITSQSKGSGAKRTISAEGRARIAAAQKRRWAKQRREKQA
jgi:hypothetical protein